jgi:4'-phosphopantetheinyl transferase
LKVEPSEIVLTRGHEGKPQLQAPNPNDLQFNLTHASRFTLIAVARGANIGIDLEVTNLGTDQVELARHILSAREREAFAALPEQVKLERFYLLWTMKEALLKGIGTGFLYDPRKLELGIDPAPVEVRQIVLDDDPHGVWTLLQLPVDQGYKAALAVQGVGWSLEYWTREVQLQD